VPCMVLVCAWTMIPAASARISSTGFLKMRLFFNIVIGLELELEGYDFCNIKVIQAPGGEGILICQKGG